MQRIDVIILAALVVAAAGSAIGVMTYEDDRLAQFRISWDSAVTRTDLPAKSHTGAGEIWFTFDVTERNVSTVSATVTMAASAARLGPTEYLVELVDPDDNVTASAEGTLPMGGPSQTDVPVVAELTPVPDLATLGSGTPDSARAELDARFGSELGIGTWTVRVIFAPSGPAPLAQEPHTTAVRIELHTYSADIAPDTPEVPR